MKDEHPHLIECVRRWGGLTTDALLDPQTQLFHIPQLEGFIGYRIACGCAVVYGDPVCAPDHIPQLAQAFHHFCQGQCKNIVYLTVSEKFTKWAVPHLCKASIKYGEEIFLDPHNNPQEKQGTHASLVRRKVRHAERAGVTVKEYLPYEASMERAMEQISIEWLQARRGLQVHISNIHLFDHRLGKRWFYAHQGDQVIGVVVLNQLHSREGWHLNHLMCTPKASGGTQELLIISVLETLKREDCSFISFGAAAVHPLGEMIGFNRISTWTAYQAFKIANKIFHLQGHRMFWGKFFPQTRPSYLLFAHPHIGLREIVALMRATNTF